MPKSATNADGLLLEWGDRLFYEPVRSRKAPRTSRAAWASRSKALRAQIARTIRHVPEVMVKITNRRGGQNGMGAIRAHLEYISRHGQVELEDQDGHLIAGRPDVQDLVHMWRVAGRGIAETSTRREAFNVMLSMPPSTDRAVVKDAARAFAREEFGEQQDYVFAAHDDEAHPHVHIVVLARGRDGRRLNPRKADLQRWRERFAQELRDRGVEANATPRCTRGATQRYERQSVRHMRERGVEVWACADSLHDARAVFDAYLPMLSGWRAMAVALAASSDIDDQKLAKAVAGFARQIPVVTALRGQSNINIAQPREPMLPTQKNIPDIQR